MKNLIVTAFFAILFSFTSNSTFAQTTDKDVTIIELTQVDGAFETQTLNLKSGKYQFRIVNKDIKKEVGFVIQKEADKDGDLMKTAIKESFATAPVKTGEAQYTGVVTLNPGNYVYSCPLNPTPHYSIVVD